MSTSMPPALIDTAYWHFGSSQGLICPGVDETRGETIYRLDHLAPIYSDTSSPEVIQIGLADLEGEKVLDCLTRYSEGITLQRNP